VTKFYLFGLMLFSCLASFSCFIAPGWAVETEAALLADQLGDDDQQVREKAAAQLREMLEYEISISKSGGATLELIDLTKALVDQLSKEKARWHAQKLLNQLMLSLADDFNSAIGRKRESAVGVLNTVLQTVSKAGAQPSSLLERSAVEKILGSALEAYEDSIESRDSEVREAGARGLREAFELFWVRLGYRNWSTRKGASNLLERILDIVENALKNRNNQIRLQAADLAIDFLEYAQPYLDEASFRARRLRKTIFDALVELLNNRKSEIRAASAKALGDLGDARAVPQLVDILDDKDQSVSSTAARALIKITGADFGVDQKKWKNWWKKNK